MEFFLTYLVGKAYIRRIRIKRRSCSDVMGDLVTKTGIALGKAVSKEDFNLDMDNEGGTRVERVPESLYNIPEYITEAEVPKLELTSEAHRKIEAHLPESDSSPETPVDPQASLNGPIDSCAKESKYPEEFHVMWATLEYDIKVIINENLTQPGLIESGGLDPQSRDHYLHCLDGIQDALLEQRPDVALSYLYGTKEVFKDTHMLEVRQFLDCKDDLNILNQIFFWHPSRSYSTALI